MKKMEIKKPKFITNEEIYRLVMILGLYLGIILLVLAIIALAKNVEEIKTDPIIYGMEKNNFTSCLCSKKYGQVIPIYIDDYKRGKG